MEEVVMALRTRPDYFGNVTTRIDTQEFLAASQMVSRLTGIPVQPNKAIVGEMLLPMKQKCTRMPC